MTTTNSQRSLRFETWRLFVVFGIIVLVLAVLLARLISLQVVGSKQWVDAAVENYTKNISTPAVRGIIYDRNGFILARNVASYNITVTPAYLPDDDADVQRIYRALSDLTGIPVNQGTLEQAKLYAACVEGPGISQLVELGDSLAPYSPVEIKCNVSEDVARLVQEHSSDWPGVAVEILLEPLRHESALGRSFAYRVFRETLFEDRLEANREGHRTSRYKDANCIT